MAEKNCLECGIELFPKKFQHALKRCTICASKVFKRQCKATAIAFKERNRPDTKLCKRCNSEYSYDKTCSLYCAPCKPLAHKESDVQYKKNNKHAYKALSKKRHEENYIPVPPRGITCSWCRIEFIANYKRAFCGKECKRQSDNAYRRAHPENSQKFHATRRARKAKNGGMFTTEEWKLLCDSVGNCCFDCGIEPGPGVIMSVGHIVPLCKGGTSFIYNIIPQCYGKKSNHCNSKQGPKIHPLFEEPTAPAEILFAANVA